MPCTVGTVTSEDRESTLWKIYGERLVDENPFIRLSIASVGLPDGTEFEQYVMRMRRTATTVVVDNQNRVLLMLRHRFIVRSTPTRTARPSAKRLAALARPSGTAASYPQPTPQTGNRCQIWVSTAR